MGQSSETSGTLSDYLLHAVLSLLKKEVSDHGRHLTQYFHLFQMYANLGVPEVRFLTMYWFFAPRCLIYKIYLVDMPK